MLDVVGVGHILKGIWGGGSGFVGTVRGVGAGCPSPLRAPRRPGGTEAMQSVRGREVLKELLTTSVGEESDVLPRWNKC